MKRIDSIQNGSVKTWRKLHTRKERDKSNRFLVEGFHLVEEGLKRDVVEVIILTEEVNIPSGWNTNNADVFLVTDEIMKSLSETETPQGIIAVCNKGKEHILSLSNGKFLLLDAVQDPGNIGTMIRTADSAGMDGVIIGNGCVDIYNSKAIRSTQGSIFHLPIVKGDLKEWIPRLQEEGVTVYGTSLQNAGSYKEVEPTGSFALMLGNEGNGVAEEHLALTDKNVYIPIYGGAESLNVSIAAGILMYYFRG